MHKLLARSNNSTIHSVGCMNRILFFMLVFSFLSSGTVNADCVMPFVDNVDLLEQKTKTALETIDKYEHGKESELTDALTTLGKAVSLAQGSKHKEIRMRLSTFLEENNVEFSASTISDVLHEFEKITQEHMIDESSPLIPRDFAKNHPEPEGILAFKYGGYAVAAAGGILTGLHIWLAEDKKGAVNEEITAWGAAIAATEISTATCVGTVVLAEVAPLCGFVGGVIGGVIGSNWATKFWTSLSFEGICTNGWARTHATSRSKCKQPHKAPHYRFF